jgi:bifunctional UDP-N-acetylglucosamine pyrophosphorylase / glucosamine-1-phosphate N-acetyltransferase
MKPAGVVLAAGLGKRMNSSLPKVLHTILGRSMLQHVLNTIREIVPQKIVVVVGENSVDIRKSIKSPAAVSFAFQKVAKGTGDALLKALPLLRGIKTTVIVVNGDTPLVSSQTLRKFLKLHRKKRNDMSLLSFNAGNPGSYGRIIRNEKGEVLSVVEDRDATQAQKTITEVNSGVYAIEPGVLRLLKKIKLNALKREYYLTDIVDIAKSEGLKVHGFMIGSEEEFLGVNTPGELKMARDLMKKRVISKWLGKGVNFLDEHSVFLSCDAEIGRGTTIYPNVHIEGDTTLGKGCIIYPNVRIHDSVIGDRVVIRDSTVIENAVVEKRASIGPFAHLRPASVIGSGAKIGNFVEVKKSVIGSGTKASHLSYIGDAKIGRDVNIGAGTITCNYDGRMKHTTAIGDGVFIGSDSQLIAPVSVGKGAYVGAGSTITRDVPSRALAVSRTSQKNIEGWAIKRQLKVKIDKLKIKKK